MGDRSLGRVLRFAAASTIFLAILAWPLYVLRSEYLHHAVVDASGRLVFVNRIGDAQDLPIWLFALPLFYVGLPIMAGTAIGRSVRATSPRWRRVGRILAGPDPAPRAWDYVFSLRPAAAMRMRLKTDGSWLGGFYGSRSYAAGYPEEPQDLYLERTFAMDQDDGSFVHDADHRQVELGTALLIRWDEVSFVEFVFDGEEGP